MTTGYELSIYAASPLIWIFLICSAVSGIFLMVLQVYENEQLKWNWWVIGLLITVLTLLIILSIPSLRGYAFYGRGDALAQLGFAKDMIINGSIIRNHYPITHILWVSIYYMSSIPLEIIIGYFPAFIFCLYIVGIYILSENILTRKEQIGLIVTSSLLIGITHNVPYPQQISIFIFPLIFYLFHVNLIKPSPNYRFLIIIFAILYPFFHPLSSIVLIFAFMIQILLNYLAKNKLTIMPNHKPQMFLPLISTIPFLMWSFYNSYLEGTIGKVVKLILNEGTTSPMVEETLHMFNKYDVSVTEILFKMYGHIIVYFIISLFAAIIITKMILEYRKDIIRIFVLLGYFALACSLQLFHLIVPVLHVNLDRFMGFILVISPIFVGFALDQILFKSTRHEKSNGGKHKRVYIASIVLTLLLVSGIFNVYPSPYINFPNNQVTHLEIDGMTWFFKYGDTKIDIIELNIRPFRFAQGILGVNGAHKKGIEGQYNNPELEIPDHFNYTLHETIGESYTKDMYMILSEYDNSLQNELFKKLGRFSENDFAKIKYDKTVDHMYSNGELDVYLVHPNKSF